VHDYEPREFTHHPREPAGISVFGEGGEDTFVHRLDSLKADAPIFLGEFGASRWAKGVNAYYGARISACEARGISWAAFRWPTRDTAYEAADDMFNLTLGGHSGDPAAIDVLRPGWGLNARRPVRARLRGRS